MNYGSNLDYLIKQHKGIVMGNPIPINDYCVICRESNVINKKYKRQIDLAKMMNKIFLGLPIDNISENVLSAYICNECYFQFNVDALYKCGHGMEREVMEKFIKNPLSMHPYLAIHLYQKVVTLEQRWFLKNLRYDQGYFESIHWKLFRRYRRFGGFDYCNAKNSKQECSGPINVHHTTYDIKGFEDQKPLLCSLFCEKHHNILYEEQKKDIFIDPYIKDKINRIT
jgi:hypothetical protein